MYKKISNFCKTRGRQRTSEREKELKRLATFNEEVHQGYWHVRDNDNRFVKCANGCYYRNGFDTTQTTPHKNRRKR